MRLAICDDDPRELERLLTLIRSYQESRGVCLDCRIFTNGTDLLCGLRRGEYDLLLLDIIMPGFSGIQVARELRAVDKNVKILFLTSSAEFAVESYAVGAYHYLLKPANAQTIFPLLDKVIMEQNTPTQESMLLRGRDGVVRLPFSTLEYVEVMNKTVSFHLLDGSVHEVGGALSDFEDSLLTRPEFLKIHRSFLVNLRHVQAISAKSATTRVGHSLPISRTLYAQVKEAYMRHLFQSQQDMTPPAISPSPQTRQHGQSDGLWRFLVVDDDPSDLGLWAGRLRAHGCEVQTADSAAGALRLAALSHWDCVLLDVRLPDEDGFSLCRRLNEHTSALILFLSNFNDTESQLQGFSCGGVDYITKDTPADLFWAKVETRLRLSRSDRTQLCFGPLLLDFTAHKARMAERDLQLTPTEFDLLWLLSRRSGRVYTPEELYRAIWASQPWDGGQAVQVHMSRLRRKLEKSCSFHIFIETVWGQGYLFTPIEAN